MREISIRRNFIMNAVLAVSGIIFPLISFHYTSRILLPEGTGKVSFATSLIAYFTMFAQMGLPTYGIRACAAARDDREALSRTVHELMSINLMMMLIAYFMLAISMIFIPRLAEERLLYAVMSVSIMLNSIGMEWLYKGLEQYTFITVRSLVFKLTALIALFLMIHRQEDYVVYGGISVFASAASNILNLVCARKYIDFRRPAGCDWKRHLKPTLVFFAMACAATVYTNLDTLMLGFLATDADVGYYNAAVKVKSVLVTLVTALGAVLLPRSSWYVEQGRIEDFHRMTQKALRFVLLTATAVTVYFILYAKECILVLSGEAFLPAEMSMRIIMPTVLLIGLTNVIGIQTLVPLGKEMVVLWSEIAGAVVDLILNMILIPRYQADGAAVGTLVAEVVVLAVQYAALHQELREYARKYKWGKLLTALFLAMTAGYWVRLTGWRPVLMLIVSAVCFFGVYGCFLLWRKEEILTDCYGRLKQKKRRMDKQA